MSNYSIVFYLTCLIFQTIFYVAFTIIIDYLIFKYKTKEKNIIINPGEYISSADLIKQAYMIMDLTEEQKKDYLVVDNLYKQYDRKNMTVKKVHFVIQRGTIFSLIGPNSSGKSTIYNIITMDLSKSLGNVYYFGT
jgi:ABC-type glutathione transport system ATPase component